MEETAKKREVPKLKAISNLKNIDIIEVKKDLKDYDLSIIKVALKRYYRKETWTWLIWFGLSSRTCQDSCQCKIVAFIHNLQCRLPLRFLISRNLRMTMTMKDYRER
jgi:hypothetical protein